METVPVKKLREGARIPTFGSSGAAGADLYACMDAPITIEPGKTAFIPTGLSMALPEGYVGLVCARSGLACRSGLAPANKVGVIDCDYRGEFIVALHNHSGEAYTVHSGDRIAQLLLLPVLCPRYTWAEELEQTERGAGGFGSTGNR